MPRSSTVDTPVDTPGVSTGVRQWRPRRPLIRYRCHSASRNALHPEEALVAALSSCHMPFFLSFAAKRGFVVDRYLDAAEGAMMKNEKGRFMMTKVVLNPRVDYHGNRPDRATEERMHHQAHELCYIANSVTAEVEMKLPE